MVNLHLLTIPLFKVRNGYLLLLSTYSINAFSQWTPQTSNTSNDLNSVFFTSSTNGAALDGGIQVRTSNGGSNWSSSPGGGASGSLQMINSSVGFATGNSGQVLKTTDGGVTWISSFSDTLQIMVSLHFPTAQVGYAVGVDYINLFGAVVKTTDGGNTWNILANPAIDIINDVFFVNADTGWIVGFDGMGDFIYKTVDGGANWITQTPVGNGMIWAITCTTPDSCWCAGNSGGQISRSINGGNYRTLSQPRQCFGAFQISNEDPLAFPLRC